MHFGVFLKFKNFQYIFKKLTLPPTTTITPFLLLFPLFLPLPPSSSSPLLDLAEAFDRSQIGEERGGYDEKGERKERGGGERGTEDREEKEGEYKFYFLFYNIRLDQVFLRIFLKNFTVAEFLEHILGYFQKLF